MTKADPVVPSLPRLGATDYLPVHKEDLERKYTPNDVPGDALLCQDLPTETPEESSLYPSSFR